MRNLWTDGWNSFWHFTFGVLTYKIPIILVIFLVYQLLAKKGIYDKNVSVDILEYFIGLTSMIAATRTADYLGLRRGKAEAHVKIDRSSPI